MSNTNPAFRELRFECREAEIEINQPSVSTKMSIQRITWILHVRTLRLELFLLEGRRGNSELGCQSGRGLAAKAAVPTPPRAGGRAGVVWARAY